jgi:hypothetical protein
MTKKVELKFEESSIERTLKQVIRKEMEEYCKKQDKEITRLVLTKLLHDCRIEIIPNRRGTNVLQTKKNMDEK